MATATDEVIALERRLWEESGDPRVFREVMDDRAISVMEPMGFITKSKAIEMMEPGEGWGDLRMQDVHAVELTPDCVALAYHAQAKSRKANKPYRGTVNSVYVKRDGAWKLGMTSHQAWPEKGA